MSLLCEEGEISMGKIGSAAEIFLPGTCLLGPLDCSQMWKIV
jgi:hypothetical protein